MTVENYHLKWDSHHTHLNSSVATLYKNEKYADVVLYSSNKASLMNNTNHIPTIGISAHKFILSSCSQYFSTIFEASPVTNHGVFYIVLPPELSHRAIQILVQYMYMGEATVSNDILSEVLRGGEILKIRGLCRTNTTIPTATNGSSAIGNGGGGNAARTYNSTQARLNGDSTSVRYLIEQQQQQHLRGLGASVLPKDSPVIMKSPKPLRAIVSNSTMNSCNSKSNSSIGSGISEIASTASDGSVDGGGAGVSGITIKKEVAIDPEDKCCYPTESITTTKSVLAESSTIYNEIGYSNCTLGMDNKQQSRQSLNTHLTRDRCQNNEPIAVPHSTMERNTYHLDQHHHRLQQSQHLESNHIIQEYEKDIFPRVNQSAECSNGNPDYSPLTDNYKIFTNSTQQQSMDDNTRCRSISPMLEKFANVKQEPREWQLSPILPLPPASVSTNQIISSTATTIVKDELDAINDGPLSQLPHTVLDFELSDIKAETVLNSAPPTSYILTRNEQCNTNDVVMSSSTSQQLQTQPQVPSSLSLSSSCINDYDQCITCDMCDETFEDLSTLLRHLDAFHATTSAGSPAYNLNTNNNNNDSNKNSSNSLNESNTLTNLIKSYVPKKRRRTSENNLAAPVILQCDLCNISFETAADWVRHMNCQHTEIELSIFNNKKGKDSI